MTLQARLKRNKDDSGLVRERTVPSWRLLQCVDRKERLSRKHKTCFRRRRLKNKAHCAEYECKRDQRQSGLRCGFNIKGEKIVVKKGVKMKKRKRDL